MKIGSGLRNYTFMLVLLVFMATLTFWSISSGFGGKEGLPPIDALSGVLLVVVGLVAGLIGGIIGTGGCSIMLPILHLWLGFPATVAIGTTLFAVVFTATSGAYGHLIRKNVDKRAVLWLGGFGLAGVVLGSWIFTQLAGQSSLLGLILGLAFLLPIPRMIWEGLKQRKEEGRVNIVPGSKHGLGIFGFLIGITTGLVGLGGGYALVPGLIYLFHTPVYIAVGTSLATMIPLSVVGTSIKMAEGFVFVDAGLLLGIGAVIGAQFGAAIIKRFKTNTIKLIFSLYFLYVSIKLIAGYFGIMIW